MRRGASRGAHLAMGTRCVGPRVSSSPTRGIPVARWSERHCSVSGSRFVEPWHRFPTAGPHPPSRVRACGEVADDYTREPDASSTTHLLDPPGPLLLAV